MENSKEWYLSKTFWVNISALGLLIVQQFTGFVIRPEEQAAILVLINLVLRAITGQTVTFGGKIFGRRGK